MKRRPLVWSAIRLIVGTLLTVSASGWALAQSPVPGNDEIWQILVDRIDKYHQSVGMVVGVIEPDGRRIVSYGRLAPDVPMTPSGDTIFEIGSITKVFTGLLLADMVERGEVNLDDPIAMFLPPDVVVPERGGKQIRLRELALHTSGLPRDPPVTTYINPFADYAPAQLYDFLYGYQLTRDIGSAHEYSNLGYGLLGHALGLRMDREFEALVVDRITGPLGMTSTGIRLTPAQSERLARGYTYLGEVAPEIEAGALAGFVSFRSSAKDMLSLLGAFLGYAETPLAPAMESMLRVSVPYGVERVQAIGWEIGTMQRCRNGLCVAESSSIVYQSGGTNGYVSFLGYEPESRTGVVVLANSKPADGGGVQDIGMHLLDQRFKLRTGLRAPPQHSEVAIDPSLLSRYAGRYQFPQQLATVTAESNHLALLGDLEPAPYLLYPESERDFFSRYQDIQVHFEIDRRGEVTGLVFEGNGARTTIPRVE